MLSLAKNWVKTKTIVQVKNEYDGYDLAKIQDESNITHHTGLIHVKSMCEVN